MSKRYLTRAEFNAILAGLRCLQQCLDSTGGDLPDDLTDILVNQCGDDQITQEEIDTLCEDINTEAVQFTVEGDPGA